MRRMPKALLCLGPASLAILLLSCRRPPRPRQRPARTARSHRRLRRPAEAPAEATAPEEEAAAAEEGTEEEPKWDVSAPPGRVAHHHRSTPRRRPGPTSTSARTARRSSSTCWATSTRVPIDGGEATALTDGIEWNFQPRFSPDGTEIAFVSDRGGADNLWIMDADGTDPRAVTEEKEHLVHNPSWSPDGELIWPARRASPRRAASRPARSGCSTSAAAAGCSSPSGPHGTRDQKTMAEPAFSPDGRYVYYSQDTTPGRVWQYNKDSTGEIFAIKRLDRETGETDVVAGGPGGAIRPTPSPDGKRLAFVKRLPGADQRASTSRTSTAARSGRSTTGFERDLQETSGSQGNAPAIAWTPDSAVDRLLDRRQDPARRRSTAARSRRIPVHVRAEKKIQPALRFPVEVAPDRLRRADAALGAATRRTARRSSSRRSGHLYVKDLATGAPAPADRPERPLRVLARASRATAADRLHHLGRRGAGVGAGRRRPAAARAAWSPRSPATTSSRASRPTARRSSIARSPAASCCRRCGPRSPASTPCRPAAARPAACRARASTPTSAPTASASCSPSTSATARPSSRSRASTCAGHDERTHLHGDKATEFSVSPDGRWVAFTEQYNAYVAPFPRTGRTVELGRGSEVDPGAPGLEALRRVPALVGRQRHAALGARRHALQPRPERRLRRSSPARPRSCPSR